MIIVDCKKLSDELISQYSKDIWHLKKTPTLGVILVGDNSASQIYVKKKEEACKKIGINSEVIRLSETTSENNVISLIENWNVSLDIQGILVQLPLPKHMNSNLILNKINPNKDVDCFSAHNLGMLLHDQPIFLPCTPAAICKFLNVQNIDVLGKHVVIINDSIVVGRPLSLMLRNKGATVTMCNQYTKDIKNISKSGDIVVVAVGKRPFFTFTKEFCKKNAIIIDVGINKLDRVVGDVDLESIDDAQMVTKVPGGIGLLTICMLMNNLIKAARISEET